MSVPSIISMPKNNLINLGLNFSNDIHYQLSPEQLTQQAVDRGEGVLCDTGIFYSKLIFRATACKLTSINYQGASIK